ncbi:monovalent cation/H+ antiporter complex subunit F [Actinomadura sp. 6N118]|uniref:monovalent cation/H+ antiporter complex subunit F n=1 Tax=Actinomadura sp. 6N118 TaxID=3375151 RepID=UPI00378A52EE
MTLVATVVLAGALLPTVLTTLYGRPVDRLAGLMLVGPLVTLVLMVLAAGYGRSAYLDVALVLSVLSCAGSLVFARFLGRTL